jgi:hypothetical protein
MRPAVDITPVKAPEMPAGNLVGSAGIELYKFEIKESAMWPAKRLRFTLELRLDMRPANPAVDSKPRVLSIIFDGCLARRDKHGELSWTPPQIRAKNYYASVVFVSPDLYADVLAALAGSKYMDILFYVPATTTFKPKDIDPTLPENITA